MTDKRYIENTINRSATSLSQFSHEWVTGSSHAQEAIIFDATEYDSHCVGDIENDRLG